MKNDKVVIYTDGSCRGNPGPGGWAIVIFERENSIPWHVTGTKKSTTNNRMEMEAIIAACKLAKGNPDKEFIVYTDSAYCCNMINSWMAGWARNDWKTSRGKEIKNLDLVKELYKFFNTPFFNVELKKVSGHQGEIGNELADKAARGDEEGYGKLIRKHYYSIS